LLNAKKPILNVRENPIVRQRCAQKKRNIRIEIRCSMQRKPF
jgi:hypothetical protein